MIKGCASVEELYDNRLKYTVPKKTENIKLFMTIFPPFMQAVANGVEFTDRELEKLPYYNFLIARLNPVDRLPVLKRKGKRHVLNIMKNGINLFHDIKKNGLKTPLEFHIYNSRLCLFKGGRRLVILKILGHETVPSLIREEK